MGCYEQCVHREKEGLLAKSSGEFLRHFARALASAGALYVWVMMSTSVTEMSRSNTAKNTGCQIGSANCE